MRCVIGIDIGGSTTKIVGFRERELIGTLSVRAGDQLTSAYGAFGKFLNQYGLNLGDVERVMFTGVGATFIRDGFYGLPTSRVDEFMAIGGGGRYLSGYERAIIVSMGTGTAFVRVINEKIEHLGGSGVGGGTLVGLSGRVIGIRQFENIVELAGEGNLLNVDLTLGDISRDAIASMPMDTTASNFGKLSDMATNADIALGIVNLVFQTIGMMAIFAARDQHIRDIVLTGNLSTVAWARQIFSALEKLHEVKFLIPRDAEYATAIGAALHE